MQDDYENAINNICIFGEFVAKELSKKINKKNVDFKTAMNLINNYKMKANTKINYNFLGSVLYPIYYCRNQKLHPYSKIDIDEFLAELLFTNLSSIIDYLEENKIKL
ncbi:hypothetical protein LCGC14_1471400 [marine sediment metagenome]|uniref:Uncharacterized protein n=1 Tax=marine sediment metagenome TaxID=412755 RepID=A0A0F9JCX1_9ZZZZ